MGCCEQELPNTRARAAWADVKRMSTSARNEPQPCDLGRRGLRFESARGLRLIGLQMAMFQVSLRDVALVVEAVYGAAIDGHFGYGTEAW